MAALDRDEKLELAQVALRWSEQEAPDSSLVMRHLLVGGREAELVGAWLYGGEGPKRLAVALWISGASFPQARAQPHPARAEILGYPKATVATAMEVARGRAETRLGGGVFETWSAVDWTGWHE